MVVSEISALFYTVYDYVLNNCLRKKKKHWQENVRFRL